jgi:hypothetical protein
VDPVPDPLLLRKSGSAGNRTQTFGSVARNLTTRSQQNKIVSLNIVSIINVVLTC